MARAAAAAEWPPDGRQCLSALPQAGECTNITCMLPALDTPVMLTKELWLRRAQAQPLKYTSALIKLVVTSLSMSRSPMSKQLTCCPDMHPGPARYACVMQVQPALPLWREVLPGGHGHLGGAHQPEHRQLLHREPAGLLCPAGADCHIPGVIADYSRKASKASSRT